jgi:uncharacterized protein (DUF1919 family)
MMIRILQAREAQKKKLQKADNVPVKNKVPPGKNHEDDHQDLRTKEDLFPNYPWKYDSEAIFPQNFQSRCASQVAPLQKRIRVAFWTTQLYSATFLLEPIDMDRL